ncbi:MAG: ParA family protein [Clostridia bacterium]|nr:ParA family protein [Clostridia bacterium]
MGKIIAFTNQKGGVGKTTTAVNVAASLGIIGKKVLLIDLDPQGSATSGVGISKKALNLSIKDLFRVYISGESEKIRKETVKNAIKTTEFENLSIIPSVISLSDTEFSLYKCENSAYFLKDALSAVRDDYDYLVIDCPPSLGMLTLNAMTACDGIIIPMQCEFYALEGLSQLMINVSSVRRNFNPDLNVIGILLTMYAGRLILTAQVSSEIRRHYESKLFKTKISRSVKLSEAPSFGCPVYYHDRSGKSSKEYLELAREIVERI